MSGTSVARVTYIWVSGKDTHHDIRGKDRAVYLSNNSDPNYVPAPEDLPVWNFDGSSTNQAKGLDTEILVRPVRVFRCLLPTAVPAMHAVRWYVALCECYLPDGVTPTIDNTRALARDVFARGEQHAPWYGIEQEYVLMANNRPVGWPVNGYPAPQGPYYCGSGADAAPGRRLVDLHFSVGLAMGLKLSGTNGEVMPGQWEFQVGPCEGLEAGDHLIVARWLYLRLLEIESDKDGVLYTIDYSAKPIKGDWNGSGMHTNFSTNETRVAGGYAAIEQYLERLSKTVHKDILVYGADNDQRLTGHHETSYYKKFSHGVGTRTTSVRIPNSVKAEKCGYMEDRRPAGDADPYLVTARLFASCVNLEAGNLEAHAEEYCRRPWMKF